MSRIYDALKKLEAERARKAAEGRQRPSEASPAAETAAPEKTAAPSTDAPAEARQDDKGQEAPEASAREAGKNAQATAEEARGAGENGHTAGGNGHSAGGNGHTAGANGHSAGGNGHGNGHGNGKRNGHRRGWRWLFPTNGHGKGNGHGNGHRVGLSFDLGPEVEEAYQRLSTNLLVVPGADAGTPRVIGLTASRHGEGTTTTAVVFACVLVRRRGERVVVVEANYRSPSLDSVLGLRRDGGFADLVQGRKSLGEVAQKTEIPNLFAIPCGRSTLGTPALFDSSGIAPALEALRAQFEFVLFDLPPANIYGETSILAPRLDGALIVIEADRARIPEVERLRRNLDRVGVRIVGSILNRKRNYIPAFIEEML